LQYHANCRRAGVDFRKQKNQLIAQIQALKAQLVGMWMVVEAMEKQVKEQSEEQTNDGTT
jgi:Tfp pilus assembly protein PilO